MAAHRKRDSPAGPEVSGRHRPKRSRIVESARRSCNAFRVPPGPTRRAVLTASALAAASLGTAGCATLNAASAAARVPPDVTVLRAAIAAKAAMIARYTATAAAYPRLRPGLDPLLGDHQAHLAELQHRLVVPAASSPAHPAATPPAQPGTRPVAPVPPGEGAAVAALASAERAAAAQHVAQLRSVPPSLAQLFASIAACEAAHVAVLGAL